MARAAATWKARYRAIALSRRETQVRFAADSSLEGDGFEPSVPVAREPVYLAEGELRGDRRAVKKIWRGTDGSNPSPFSGESAANRNWPAGIVFQHRGGTPPTSSPRGVSCEPEGERQLHTLPLPSR